MMRGQNAMQGRPPVPPGQMGGPMTGNFPPDFNRQHNPGANNSMMMSGPPPPQGNFMGPGGNMYGPPPSMSPGMDSSQPLPPSFNNYGK